MGALSDIIAAKREEVVRLRRDAALLRKAADCRFAPRGVSLHRGPGEPLRLIAELKFRSPSAGPLSRHLDVEGRAAAYEAGGAAMMSVLCDGPFFDGDYGHLARARASCNLPLLCKEFVLDEIQLEMAATSGADWVLLIVRCLDGATLKRLIAASAKLGLGALVEVHAPDEVVTALGAGANVIGVNARDLDTLEMHPEQAAHILSTLPDEVTSLHLSGLRTPSDIDALRETRVHGALIGEVLMRQHDPLPLLRSLSDAAQRPRGS